MQFLKKQTIVLCLGLISIGALAGCSSGMSAPAAATPDTPKIGNWYYMDAGQTISTGVVAQACNGTIPGAVVLPSGTVNIAATLILPSYCTIEGQGMGVSTILLAPNTSLRSPGIIANTEESATLPATLDNSINLRDFTLDANTVNNPKSSYGIWMANFANLTIDHVEVNGGMVHLGGPNAGYDASYTHDISITNSYFHDAGIAHGDDQDTLQFDAQNVKINGNTLGPSTDTGTALLGGSKDNQTAHVNISDNVYFNNAQACGVAEGDPTRSNPPDLTQQSWDVTVANNTINCSGSYAYGIFFNQSHRVTISGNNIMLAPLAGGTATSPAIYLGAVSDATVTGNEVTGSKDAGILLEANGVDTLSGVSLTGNTIRNPNTYGIYLISVTDKNPGATLQGVTITGNTIIDPGNGTAKSGIVIGQDGFSGGVSLVDGITVVGNTIVDDLSPHLMPYGIEFLGFPTGLSVGSNAVSGYTVAAYSPQN